MLRRQLSCYQPPYDSNDFDLTQRSGKERKGRKSCSVHTVRLGISPSSSAVADLKSTFEEVVSGGGEGRERNCTGCHTNYSRSDGCHDEDVMRM